MWLPPAATAVLVWAAYRLGHDAELGSRAGAEPELAGVFVSLPFVFLMCFELGLALLTGFVETYAGRTYCLVGTTVGAMVVVAAVLWLLRHGSDASSAAVVIALGLFTLAPAWVSHARDPAGSPEEPAGT
jgi:hypothetical protein